MMGSVYLILILSGQIRFTGFGVKDSLLGTFAVNLIMWIPQGASEEVMFRGFMIPQISTQYKRGVAVFLSSLLFALFHSLNAGFSPLAAINLFIIALLFALIYIKTGNIWMTCAVHTVWNLAQGNLFGLEVSGTDSGASLLHTSYISGAKAIATGGQFGPEGGLAVTFVVLVALAAVTISLVRSGRAVTG
jgi:membrane protease YdiL (CAAX protease family)